MSLALIATMAGACGNDSGDPAIDAGARSTTTAVLSDQACTTQGATPTSTPGTSTTATETASTSSITTGSTSTSTMVEPTTTQTVTTTEPSTTAPPSTDPQVAAHQQRLTDLGYWLGPVDGQLGSMTAHAVTAFQKAEGLPRTGVLDDATVERLSVASTPAVRSSSGQVLEVDLDRQILLVATGGRTERIYDIATGSSATPTPAGRFTITRQIDGIRHAPLGTLYRPKYFNGGIALHGYTSVPSQPASHGCVRLTYPAMDHLWASGVAPVGAAVWVY